MCYHHIVIATDLSDDGKRLVEKGALLAEALQAKLSLIYVSGPPDSVRWRWRPSPASSRRW